MGLSSIDTFPIETYTKYRMHIIIWDKWNIHVINKNYAVFTKLLDHENEVKDRELTYLDGNFTT